MNSWRLGFVLGALVTLSATEAKANGSFEEAVPLACPFDVSGTLSTAADRNFYYVVPAVPGALDFIWSGGDPGLKATVYDDWGRWVGYLDQTANVCDVRVFVPGRYYVEVYSADGEAKGLYRFRSEWSVLGPERDGGRLHLNFDVPEHEFEAVNLIPLVAQRMEAELAPYSCAVITSKELPQEKATGEWVGEQIGPGPSNGGGGWGWRRPNGGAAAGWSGVGAEDALWQTLFGWPMGVISHESWHGFGIPHMGGGAPTFIQRDYGWYLISYNYWSKVWNLREYMTMICQSGYFGSEIEPNNDLTSATDVNPWLEQIRSDRLENDAFVASGKISDTTDIDIYSLTIRSGEKWQFDIDAAEFQYPLDSHLEVLRANGEVLAESNDATDPDSGIFCADPFIRVQFLATEKVYLRVSGQNSTVGGYHLIGKPEACFDKTGPRIYGVLPDGQSQIKSTSQIFVYFNEGIDSQTLTLSNVRLTDTAGRAIQGTISFDPFKCLMRFDAAKPLTTGTYNLRLSGLTDYAGNLLDGETDGLFGYPKVSGDRVPGGDFLSTFTVDNIYTETTPFWLLEADQDRGNGTWLILQSSGEIATASVNPTNLVIYNDGPDKVFGTQDDHIFPLLCWNYEVLVEHPTVKTEVWVWMMATLPPGKYSCDYDLIDVAGHPVQGSIPFNFATWPAGQGPRIVRVSPNPDIPHEDPFEQIEVQFSGAMNPATITPETFRVLYSANGTFLHGSDTHVTDADGIIEYDPVKYSAIFKPSDPMGPGFYRVELSGRRGGIADIDGHLLDGEYLAAGIYKCYDPAVRTSSPSGNMAEGGDYTAVITVETPTTWENDIESI